MRKSFKELVGERLGINIEFSSMLVEQTPGGRPLVKLKLVTPIAEITGSQTITDGDTSVKPEAFDVQELWIGESTIDVIDALEEEFEKTYDAEKAAYDALGEDADPEKAPVRKTVFAWRGKEGEGAGSIKSDKLFLDVSQNGDPWIVATKFVNFGRQQQAERGRQRRSGMVTRINDRKAQATLGNTNVAGPKKIVEAVA